MVVTMRVGYEVNGERSQIIKQGVGPSRKAAKTDGYRKAMSAIKRAVAPERYKVVFAVPVDGEA